MKKISVVIILLFVFSGGKAQQYILNSPNRELTVEISIGNEISVKMNKGGESLIGFSGLTLALVGENQPFAAFRVKKINRRLVDEDVKPVIRERSILYKNLYNELEVVFKSNHAITFRLFNEGLA